MLGYKPGYRHDPTFWDMARDISGAVIIEREITKAAGGEAYFINDIETGKPEHMPAVDFAVFYYYYELWENFHYFGYPHGMDWTDDRHRWFNKILKLFENTYIGVQNHLDAQAVKKAHGGGNG